MRYGDEDFNAKTMPSKCSLILIDQRTKSDVDFLEAAKILMKKMPNLPTSLIIISDTPPQDIPSVDAPTVVLPTTSPLVHYRCALADKFTVTTGSQMYKATHSQVCSLHGAKLKVAYNIKKPFFSQLTSGQLSKPSGQIEEAFLRSFIANYHLNVHFENGNDKWGSLNKTTGRWNGVVGLVSISITIKIQIR